MSRHSGASCFAEWILARFMGSERAAALIGDLLEESATRTHPLLRFWTQVLWLIVLFTVRSIAAYFAALMALFFTLVKTMTAWGPHATHQPPFNLLRTVSNTSEYACLFVAMTAFSLLRFGPRARLTWISLGFAASAITATCLWWSPAALTLAAIGLSLTLAGALRDRLSRLTLVVFATATAAATSFTMFVFWFDRWAGSAIPYILRYAPILIPIIPATVASIFYSRCVLQAAPEHEEAPTYPA